MRTFHLTIAKVGENLFDGEAVSVSLPGSEGVFEVLSGHEAFVSLLDKGHIRVRIPSGEVLDLEAVKGGIAEVSNDQATILL